MAYWATTSVPVPVALAVTSDKRHPLAPEIPTVAESYPGFEALNWVGIVAPAGVRREIVTRLNTELLRTVHLPDVGESLANRGYGKPQGQTTILCPDI